MKIDGMSNELERHITAYYKAKKVLQRINDYYSILPRLESNSKLELRTNRIIMLLKYKYNQILNSLKFLEGYVSMYLDKSKNINIHEIKKIVCGFFDLPVEWVTEKTRKREVVVPRQICHYFANKYTKSSLKWIGLMLGSKDHATVIHSCKTVRNLMYTDKQFKDRINEIDKLINLI